MSLGYLISPVLQVEDVNGLPLVGGYIRVFKHGTSIPYITWRDFDGDHNPDSVYLDAKGMAVLIAEDTYQYDVYCYDRNNVQQWSRLNVSVVATNPMMSELGALTASADDLSEDGAFAFRQLVRSGESITIDSNGKIRLSKGWYHFTAVVRLVWDATLVNKTADISLYTTLSSDVVTFDLSFAHDETTQLSGDVCINSDNTDLVIGVQQLPAGMVAKLISCSVHAITSKGGGSGVQEQSDWDETDTESPSYIKNKPEFATVATTGDYYDLLNLPTIPADKVYVFWDFEFNRTNCRAAIDAHKVIMCWNRTTNEHLFFTKYEEVTIDGNLCEIYHFAGVAASYITPFASDWRLGDTAFIYDTVRQVQWAEHDTKLFDHEVPSPTSADAGKVLTASWDAGSAEGSWSWQTATTVGTITL